MIMRHDAGFEDRRLADAEFNQGITDRVNAGMARDYGCPNCGTSYGLYELDSQEQIESELAAGADEFYKSTNPRWVSLFVPCEYCRQEHNVEKFQRVVFGRVKTWAQDHERLGL